MIRLDTTTRKLQVVLAGAVTANQLPVTCAWADATSTAYTGGATVINTNGATAVDIVAAPAASAVRDVDYVNIYNADTASATVTVRVNDNATLYVLQAVTLAAGESLTYTHAGGWTKLSQSGGRTFRSAVLISPALGIPASGDLANCTFPTLNQNTTGSAAKLTTARAINGVNFDGSAAITVPSITLASPTASTSGTTVDFTGIPSDVKRITLLLRGVSNAGSNSPLICQIGTSGGVETSGYISTAYYSTVLGSSTAGFVLIGIDGIAAAFAYTGKLTLDLESASTNSWIIASTIYSSYLTEVWLGAGSKSLSGTLDRVRITYANGTATFDAGEIAISYER